jgi:hypothetical protein
MIFGIYDISGDLILITASKPMVRQMITTTACKGILIRRQAYDLPITLRGL